MSVAYKVPENAVRGQTQILDYRSILNQQFKFPENLERGQLGVGLAITKEQIFSRLLVLTERYEQQGYLESITGISFPINSYDAPAELFTRTTQFLKEHLESDSFEKFIQDGIFLQFKDGPKFFFDKYSEQSVGFLARYCDPETGEIIDAGSARLIFSTPELGLPTFSDSTILLNPGAAETYGHVTVEFSQFARKKDLKHVLGLSPALLRAASLYCRQLGLVEWVATTDDHVVKLMNGLWMKFNLPHIGPPVFYLGSNSTPIYIHFDEALRNAESPTELELVETYKGLDLLPLLTPTDMPLLDSEKLPNVKPEDLERIKINGEIPNTLPTDQILSILRLVNRLPLPLDQSILLRLGNERKLPVTLIARQNMAKFIRGERNVPGYEDWYVGF